MSIFDDIAMPAPRPVCPECGVGVGRGGETPGATVRPHDRADQAMRAGSSNPCPGAGIASIPADAYTSANDRMRAASRKANGGIHVRCGNRPTHHTIAFVADKVTDTGIAYRECSVCGEAWEA